MGDKERVVVTGLGLVSPLGLDEPSVWQNMLAGRSGIAPIRAIDTAPYKTRNGAEVDDASLTAALASRKIKPWDRAVDMALLASEQALLQARVVVENPPRTSADVATLFGTGTGSALSVYQTHMAFAEKGVRGIRPTAIPRGMANAVSAQVSLRFRLTGPNYVIVCTCTSSTTAIGTGFRMIRDGYAQTVLCGGTDALFNPCVYGAWNNLGIMSKQPDPKTCCRPFDAGRDGFVLGEGAGALVLESLEQARRRQSRIRAEILGFGESSDAHHVTRPSAEGQARAIAAALACAGIGPRDVGFVNAHGTATAASDECECRSLSLALGDHARRVPVASNKSFFGHLIGASGAVETIVAILGLEHGKVPPNLNLDHPDPACDLDFVGPAPLEIDSPIAMKNSFAFGGNNAVLILRRWDEPPAA